MEDVANDRVRFIDLAATRNEVRAQSITCAASFKRLAPSQSVFLTDVRADPLDHNNPD